MPVRDVEHPGCFGQLGHVPGLKNASTIPGNATDRVLPFPKTLGRIATDLRQMRIQTCDQLSVAFYEDTHRVRSFLF